jgi:DNA polymerase delta subunit 1
VEGDQRRPPKGRRILLEGEFGPDRRRAARLLSFRSLSFSLGQDTDIAHKLDEKLLIFLDKMEMCRATGVPFSYIITRGQQIKVMSLLLREARKYNFLVPTNNEKDPDAVDVAAEKYKGATVIDPRPGFYDDIVSTLDFSALYPSIMRRKNMCFTTRVDPSDAKNFKEIELYRTDTETGPVFFVRHDVKNGLLPQILENLTAKRNLAKAEMKKNEGKDMEKVYDKRQNALKVTSNSVYGYASLIFQQQPVVHENLRS